MTTLPTDRSADPVGGPAPAAGGDRAGLAAELVRSVRATMRRTATLEVLLAGFAAVTIALLAAGLLDYLLRLPSWLRMIALLIGIGFLLAGVVRRLLPAVRLAPPLTSVAMRLERATGADALPGVLAAGVALDEPGKRSPVESELRRRAVAAADAAAGRLDRLGLVSTGPLRRRAISAAVVIAAATVIAAVNPGLAGTALERALLPLSGAEWPKRFRVEAAPAADAHPIGVALPARAVVTATTRALGETPVVIVYRMTDDQSSRPWRRERMTPQVFDASIGGEVYERLIDPGLVRLKDQAGSALLEYWFETPDDRSPTTAVTLVHAPEVVAAAAAVTPPGYAAGIAGNWLDGAAESDGSARAGVLVSPVLAGSSVEIRVELNKPAAFIEAETLAPLDADAPPTPVAVDTAALPTGVLRLTATQSGRIRFRLRDEYGLESLDETIVRIDAHADTPPSVAVIDPPRDESVLADAVITVIGEGEDDVGLQELWLETTRSIVPGGDERSPGAAPEPEADAETVARVATTEQRATASAVLDLAGYGLRPGDELLVTAVAADAYELNGQTHEPQRSEPRRLRIISTEQLIDEVLADLSATRRAAIRLDGQQEEIEQAAESAQAAAEAAQPEAARQQAAVAAGLARMGRAVRAASDRLDRNGVRDESLERVLEEAQDAIAQGQDAAERTERELAESAAESSPEPLESALEASRDVRRSLETIARTLDRGEDAWAVRRALEGLLGEQGEVSEDTQTAGAESIGRQADELTPEQRTTLDEIARRQLELAERTRAILDELEDKADESAETDAGQSAALRAASRRGRENGVASQLQRAAEAIAQNQTAEAGRAQQEAEDQLREMLADIENAERQRDAELRRALLSLTESIEGLITDQQSVLAQLARGDGTAVVRPIAIRLSRNTFAVIDEALATPETADAAASLRASAEHQGQAIAAIQAQPMDRPAAQEQGEASLMDLEAALAAAEEALQDAEQRERERRKQELSAAYGEQLEMLVAVRDETAGFTERRLSRRDRQAVRGLATAQDAVRDALRALPIEFPEITDAVIFNLAHERLDTVLTGSAAELAAGRAGRREVAQQDSAIRLVQGLIDALRDPEPGDDDNFGSGSGGGEQGGGAPGGEAPLIPPLAELTLLRTLQQDVYDQTRLADDDGDRDAAASIARQQRDLAEQAEILLESLETKGGPPGLAPGQPQPAPQPEIQPEGTAEADNGTDEENAP
ncbi:MAG: hypothetical protein AAGF47_05435 [Planctomycetota bacterium]